MLGVFKTDSPTWIGIAVLELQADAWEEDYIFYDGLTVRDGALYHVICYRMVIQFRPGECLVKRMRRVRQIDPHHAEAVHGNGICKPCIIFHICHEYIIMGKKRICLMRNGKGGDMNC